MVSNIIASVELHFVVIVTIATGELRVILIAPGNCFDVNIGYSVFKRSFDVGRTIKSEVIKVCLSTKYFRQLHLLS